MTIKKKLFSMVLAIVLLGTLAGCGSNTAMIVNGQKVSQGAFDFYLQSGMAYLQNFGIDTTTEEGKQYLPMIEEQAVTMVTQIAVIRAAAIEQGVKVDSAEVNKLLEEEKQAFKDEKEYKAWLKTNNMTEKDVKWVLENGLYEEGLYKAVNKDITASDEAVKSLYEGDTKAFDKFGFSHILIQVKEGASEADWTAAKTKVDDLLKQLGEGADFAKLAKENSADGSAAAGGSLGAEVTQADSPYVAEFNKAAFALQNVGDYTKEAVKTEFGYHIIKLDSKVTGLENLKDDLLKKLVGDKWDTNYSDFMTKAMESAKIDKEYVRKYTAAPTDGANAEGDNAGAGDATDGNANSGDGAATGDGTTPEAPADGEAAPTDGAATK